MCTSRARLLLVSLFLPVFASLCAFAAPHRIPVKVVVVAMFEPGNDTGDAPGELQFWVERDHLDKIYDLPGGFHPVRMNGRGEMALLTGAGTANATASVMALGRDPRFDLTHAYWIIAGIAGGNPNRISLGSAAWARWVVDADLAYEVDGREIPPDWSTGFLPLRKTKPFEQPAAPGENQVFALNPALTLWAFNLTRSVPLEDSEKLREARSHFDGAAAQLPPHIILGDETSSSTFFHGKLLSSWADEWVHYFTGGQGEYTTTAMEDSGSLLSLKRLSSVGLVDFQRVLVLRTVSNYDQQPRGATAAESLMRQRVGTYSAFRPSVEAAYAVGHTVVNEILTHWKTCAATPPSAAPAP